jgi:hypothetical protein
VLAPALTAARAFRGETTATQEAISMIAQTGVDTRWFDLAARAILGDLDGLSGEAGLPGEKVEPHPRPPYNLFDLGIASLQAEVCDVTGDAELARAAIGPLTAAHGAGFEQVVGWVASLPRLLGVVHRSLGQFDESEKWQRSAIAKAERASAAVELARGRLHLAELLMMRGDEESAAAEIDRATSVLHGLGLKALQDKADRLRSAVRRP